MNATSIIAGWKRRLIALADQETMSQAIHDVYCGLRAFRRDWYEGLGQRCTGMEFATEMIIRATLAIESEVGIQGVRGRVAP